MASKPDTQGVALGDVDGDGDLDAFTAVNSQISNRLFLNDGTGVFTDSGQEIGQVGGNVDVELGDVDADGDLDAVIARNVRMLCS